ncbi:hypothetical protein ACLOJK_007131 [Asimina triloba]
MLSLLPISSSSSSSSWFSSPPAKALLRPNAKFLFLASSPSSSSPSPLPQNNYAGHVFHDTVGGGDGRKSPSSFRLDSWISSRIRDTGISRARVQSSIRSGLVAVNGRTVDKVSHTVKTGDKVSCTISELEPLRAVPEDITLDVIYEDAHVLVVNKAPQMVVHPAPGNPNGTLVNALLHHCKLPVCISELEDCSDDEMIGASAAAAVRPGIVHRLDKGTSGLLVVAKDERSHGHLSEQFKCHTIDRVYFSLTCGIPQPRDGVVDAPIARDSNNRIRMAAVPGARACRRGVRRAVSRYKVVEVLAGGGSALVEWRLETGRTHQIRAHAKYLGIPLLGDEVYGGTKNMALSLLRPHTPAISHGLLSRLVSTLQRPCLHAFSLGFEHPQTGKRVHFSCPPPSDFEEVLGQLRGISSR